jgi:putative ABC transport system permease protein
MLIAQYVIYELSYDKFWGNSDQVFRMQLDRYDKGELSTRWAGGSLGIGPDIKAHFPEVRYFVRLCKSNAQLSFGDTYFKEEGVYYASKDFFRVFGYPLVKGVDSTALMGLNSMVISRSMAKKYFGEEDPMGKTLRNNGRTDYLITGVFEDLPENTHVKVSALLSFATYAKLNNRRDESEMSSWQWDGFLTYILLRDNASPEALEAKLPAFVEKQVGEELKQYNAGMVFHLQPLSDIHLDSNFIEEFETNGDRSTVYFLGLVAVLILIIAWINYINLSTAKSIERAREVGVRKVMGGFRQQLIQQFLFESMLLNLLAVALAIGMVVTLTPWFSGLTGKDFGYVLFQQKIFWVWSIGLIAGGALLSGMYPALVLSSYRPVEVLKGRFKNTGQGVWFRKGMVVLQFVASITLVVGTYTVYQQLDFMRSQKLGVNIDQVVVVRAPNVVDSTYMGRYEGFKQRLLQHNEVTAVCASTEVPGGPGYNAGGIRTLRQRDDESNQYRVIHMDHDFIPSYGLEMAAGRPFSADVPNEQSSVLLNESGMRLLGFAKAEDAINDQIYFWGDTFRIVGVVKNYRQESLKKAFDPLVFRYDKAPRTYYSIRFNTSNSQESMARFEQDWKELFPGNPFNYFFLDDQYNNQYKADRQFGEVFTIFAFLAICIACLGLFGLSSLTAIQRTKEIGVRKVMGASISSIIALVGKDYIILVGVAIIFAIPAAWWVMSGWLQGFANRIPLSWLLFALPSALVVVIAMITVSFHTLRAARTDPAKSLRYE